MDRKVVITGMGVIAPNGTGLPDFLSAIRQGKSGIQHFPELAALNFGCQIGGQPLLTQTYVDTYLTPLEQKSIAASGIIYGILAGMEAWQHAGLAIPSAEEAPLWDAGCIFGNGLAGAEVMRKAAYLIDEHKVKRLGSHTVPQVMASGISAYLGGKLGLGNQVTTNASACSTGTESIIMGYRHIKAGLADKMLVGGCDSSGPYVWGGFDAMRVTTRKFNADPIRGSRPMSATASGFVPGAGAGALLLESLDSAQKRHAPIYGEVLGGAINAGGQRNGGTMTAPNQKAILRCLRLAMVDAQIQANEIDLISGHLTATYFDPLEIQCWNALFNDGQQKLPYINAVKKHDWSLSECRRCNRVGSMYWPIAPRFYTCFPKLR